MDVTGYFFNPNIHPLTEFNKRLATLENFAQVSLLPLTIDKEYDLETTLLYSKYQRHDDIKMIGEELADNHGVRFLYRDFRAGWKEGVEESKRLNMYRQQYCGCIFSERDRYKVA